MEVDLGLNGRDAVETIIGAEATLITGIESVLSNGEATSSTFLFSTVSVVSVIIFSVLVTVLLF